MPWLFPQSQTPAVSSMNASHPARQKGTALENKVPELSEGATWREFLFWDCRTFGLALLVLSVSVPQVPSSGRFSVLLSIPTFHFACL